MARRQMSQTDWRTILVGLLIFMAIEIIAAAVLPSWTDNWGSGFLWSMGFAVLAGVITAVALHAWDRRHPRQD